jgi:tRNA1(Val) A37 N6-methylase TrmN6
MPIIEPLRPDERLDEVNAHLSLIQKTGGLTFGTDAYLLAAYLRKSSTARAVELGSGTGIVSLLGAVSGKFAHCEAIEIQPAYAELTERNVRLNGLTERISVRCADATSLRAADLGYEADLVFSNPPYMKTDSGKRNENDEKYAARHEVNGTVADFCAASGRLLRYGGRFVCVWRPDRMVDLIAALRTATLEPRRMTWVYADAASAPSMILLEAQKGAAPSVVCTPPILLHDTPCTDGKARSLSAQAARIYDTCMIEF